MGHIVLKRTKFKKGNFKPAWDYLNGYLVPIGRYIPSKAYYFIGLPYYHATKTTKLEMIYGQYMYKKTIKNWLN